MGKWLVPQTPLESWLRELLHLGAIVLAVVIGTQKALPVASTAGLLLVGVVGIGFRATGPLPLVEAVPFPIYDAALVAGCIGGGQIISRLIRSPNLLVPAGVVAAFVDPLGVYVGFTGQAILFTPESVAVVSSAIPTTGSATVPFISLGPGDIFFIAFFLASLYRFGLNAKAAAWGTFFIVAGLFALLLLTSIGDRITIPGLPFIACTCLLPSARAFSFSKDEKRSLLIGLAVIIPFVALLIILSRQVPLSFHRR
jgi:hypothetical protein